MLEPKQLSLFEDEKQLKIALIGRMRSGKDTVASIMNKTHSFTELKFSTGISEIITKYFPETVYAGKPREHYQHIGQSLRQLNPDIWINYLDKQLSKELAAGNSVIITDVRQKNEVDYLYEQGFTLIKVDAPAGIRHGRILTENDQFEASQFTHETENNIDFLCSDYLINNSGSLESLEISVTELLTFLIGGAESC